MTRQGYPSDLTDEKWQEIESVLPAAKGGRTGRPRKYPLREIWNAIFYQLRTLAILLDGQISSASMVVLAIFWDNQKIPQV